MHRQTARRIIVLRPFFSISRRRCLHLETHVSNDSRLSGAVNGKETRTLCVIHASVWTVEGSLWTRKGNSSWPIQNTNFLWPRIFARHSWPLPQQTQIICIPFILCWANVEDVRPALYTCYTNVSYLLGHRHVFYIENKRGKQSYVNTGSMSATLVNVGVIGPVLTHRLLRVSCWSKGHVR